MTGKANRLQSVDNVVLCSYIVFAHELFTCKLLLPGVHRTFRKRILARRGQAQKTQDP
jgi:hypothetical protein